MSCKKVMLACGILTAVSVICKLCGLIGWHWAVVLIPLFALIGIGAVYSILTILLCCIGDSIESIDIGDINL